MAEGGRQRGDVRREQALAVGREDHRHDRVVGRGEQAPPLVAQLDVEPAHGHLVALEEVAHRVRVRRPTGPDDRRSCGPRGGVPVVEQVVDHRVQALLRADPTA